MIIILITTAILIVGYIIADRTCEDYGVIPMVAAIATILALLFLIAEVLSIVFYNIPYLRKKELNRLTQTYNTIEAICKKNPDNVLLLANDITNYNVKVVNGRMAMDNKWIRSYTFDFYYELPLIELGEEK